jgi:hypothetical protein
VTVSEQKGRDRIAETEAQASARGLGELSAAAWAPQVRLEVGGRPRTGRRSVRMTSGLGDMHTAVMARSRSVRSAMDDRQRRKEVT